MHTKDDVLNSINIALTDELLHDINMGLADVYLNTSGYVHVATDLDGHPSRFVVTVEGLPVGDSDDPWLTGKWIQTFTGKRVPLDAPRAEHIDIEDIAHALSMLCRYTGHCRDFYSVAQHSVLVAQLLRDRGYSAEVQYAGLLHDAAEAYVADLNRPLKSMLAAYSVVEGDVMDAIQEALNVDVNSYHDEVKWADNVALFTERRDLLNPLASTETQSTAWQEEAYAVDLPTYTINGWEPRAAKSLFLAHYRMLRRELGR